MNIQKLLAHSMMGRGLYYFTVLAVTIFLSRYLQASDAGAFYYTLLVLSFFVLILSFSLDAAITFYVAKNHSTQWLKAMIPAWSIGAGLIGPVIANACFSLLHLTAIVMPFQFSIFVFLFIAGQCLINFSSAWLQAKQSFFWPYAIQAFSNIAFILAGLWLIQAGKERDQLFFIYFTFIFLSGVILYFMVLSQKRANKVTLTDARYSGKQFFGYAFTALWANILFFLVYRMDAWFLNQSPSCTDAELGNYLQASKLGQMLLILPQVAASVVFPQTAKGKSNAHLLHSITSISRLLSIFFMILFIFIALTGNIIFPFVFGETFIGITTPLLILIPGIYFLAVHTILAAWIGGGGYVKQNVVSAAMALVIAAIGYYFTIPLYGTIAAASVSSVSYLLLMSYSFMIVKKRINISFFDCIGYQKNDMDWLFILKRNQSPGEDLIVTTQNTADE